MYENLYEPLPDTKTYITRINMYQPVTLDKYVLNDLVYAHQCAIPFENMDISFYKKEINLGICDLYHKIVVNKRGGYCFELNNLFLALLKSINFTAHACLVKVCEGDNLHVPALHMGIIVTLSGERYYCDVGFGGPVPGGAVKLEENNIQDIYGEKYWFTKCNENWWTLSRINHLGNEENILLVNPNPKELEDFVALSHYCSCHAQQDFKFFTDNFIANIRVRDQGNYSLMNYRLVKRIQGNTEIIHIESKSELINVLKDLFYINILT